MKVTLSHSKMIVLFLFFFKERVKCKPSYGLTSFELVNLLFCSFARCPLCA